jgi:seryl-tRNA synthetase
MLDIKLVRKRPDIIIKSLKKRGDEKKIKWIKDIIEKDTEWRKLLFDLDKMRHERNVISMEINRMKKAGRNPAFNIKEMRKLNQKMEKTKKKVEKIKEQIRFYLMRLPNILHESVPVGRDENDNKVVKKWGTVRKFKFKPKSHVDLLKELGLADIERAGKISGARFYFLKNELVLMEFALMKLALDMLVKKGFALMETPCMIRRKPYEGVTDLADFEDVIYKVEGEDLYLIATSEHPLASMHMNEVLDEKSLPLKYAGFSPCFRKEAGSHGKDTKGIFRVHQFNKIEQFVFSRPGESWKEFERLIKNAEEIFKKLELPYRIVNVCTGDIGTVAAKKLDLEVWMPAQERYREVVSCSNCTDYQARRLNIRYGVEGEKPKDFVHTLNSTAVATARAIVAILENYQQADGSVAVPHILRQWMNGIKKIG